MSRRNHKVLYLSRGGDISGEPRQLLYLIKGLDRNRYTPVVLCTQAGTFVDELQRAGVSCLVHPLAAWRKLRNLLSRYQDVRFVCRLVRREGISLVHCSDFWLAAYMLRAAKRANIPSVLHIRFPIDGRKFRKYRCGEATALVVISRRVQMRLAQTIALPKDKVVLIHDAVDRDVFRPRNDHSEHPVLKPYRAGDKLLVGLVGRVERAKEQMSFVKIAQGVLKKTGNVAFLIIGQIKDQSYTAQIVHYLKAHDMLDHVHFTGYREDMQQVLAELDVLVSLSGGSVRYEAMMCGIPVVCAWSRTKEESHDLRHNETGFLVTPRDIDAVVDVLLRVIADADLRTAIGRNARAWAQEHLGHTRLVEDTERLYERLLECPCAPQPGNRTAQNRKPVRSAG